MWSLEWSKGRKRMIEEQAKEELESLQLLHPDRFEYLKLELNSFIQLLQSQSQSQSQSHQPNTDEASRRSPCPLVPDSQESSSCRKRRKMEEGGEKVYGKTSIGRRRRRRNRVDLVLERAAICLRKIRRFKTALFSTAH